MGLGIFGAFDFNHDGELDGGEMYRAREVIFGNEENEENEEIDFSRYDDDYDEYECDEYDCDEYDCDECDDEDW